MKHRSLYSELTDYWSSPAVSPQLPVWRQLLEMAAIYLGRRIGPRYYLQARWGRQSIPFKDKWQHINSAEYRQLASRLNSVGYQKASQHKLIEKSVLSLLRLPTPKFIAWVHPLRGRCAAGNPVRRPEQLSELLKQHIHKRVCFKLVEGFGGFGFASYQIIPAGNTIALLRKEGESAISAEDWWHTNALNPDGFIIESYLEQHSEMAALNDSSVNTIRIWVILDGSRWKTLGALLRIGRQGSQVDNTSSGGIVCPIDIQTGTIREAFDPMQPARSLQKHPDSQAPLVGIQIPFWHEAIELGEQAIAAFPLIRLAGLDIAITQLGPSVIELNVLPDRIGCAAMDLPLKTRIVGVAREN
jgi:hypothetical protein